MNLVIDVERLLAASGFGRYRYKQMPTRYGVLNVPCGEEVRAFDFSPAGRDTISVNIRAKPRDLNNDSISWRHDFRGFVIERDTGRIKRLNKGRSNERAFTKKTQDWREYAQYLMAYLDGLGDGAE
ncbi:MAG: hypothetical protein ISP83_05850, partial [Candidatus Poseidonia sp.]|nr:hypothetical protein [Poseidonia sp.]